MDETARLSRRQLLGLAGGVGLVAGAGAGVALDRAVDERQSSGGVPPFYGDHQAGVTTPQQHRLQFAAFDADVSSTDELRDLMREWTGAAAKLSGGGDLGTGAGNSWQPPPDTGEAAGLAPARLTLTFGFGPTLFDRLGLEGLRPAPLVALPPFPGDALDPERSGGDVCIQACADDPQVAFHAIRNLTRIGFGAVSLRWTQSGFTSRPGDAGTPRNLMGFKDGTNNLDPRDRDQMERNVWVSAGSGPAWMAGGTYLVARRIRIRTESWDRTPIGEQEQIFGRRKTSGAPLGKSREHDQVDVRRLEATAHVRLANPREAGSEGERILRRGYNFVDGVDPLLGQIDAGLFFLAFQRDPRRQFVPIQARLAANDHLNEYIQHRASALFAIPPGARPGGYVGETLLGAVRPAAGKASRRPAGGKTS